MRCKIHPEYEGVIQPLIECEDCWQVWASIQTKKKNWYSYEYVEYKEQHVSAAKVLKDLNAMYNKAILEGYEADQITIDFYTSHDNWGEFEYSSLEIMVFRDERDITFEERMEREKNFWEERLFNKEKNKKHEYEYYLELKKKYEEKC